ncbi:MAG: hypothetical protein HC850_15625 [Rhodomicrobium sp.]|nr:hypothetical protein [Rhodomicrobium sp.]
MGGEGMLLFIWMMSVLVLLAIVLKMAATQRKAAYRASIVIATAAFLPIMLSLGPDLFHVLRNELIVASVIGGVALLHSQRYGVLAVFISPTLAHLIDRYLIRMPMVPETPTIVTFVGLLGELGILLAPIFATLAAVFLSVAFIEKRRYGV